jgi:Sulfatase
MWNWTHCAQERPMAYAAVPQDAMPRFGRFWNPTVFLCVAGIILPNALSLGALAAGIGSPPRTAAIIAYATVAVIARIVPTPLTILLFLAAAAYDAVATIALLFNLAPSEIMLALHLSADLKLFASPLYMAMITGLALLLGVNIAVLTLKRETLRRGNPAIMMALALAFATVDFFTNASAHYMFGTLYAKGKPMESAAEMSGFRDSVLAARDRNVLLIVVEALGQFADPWRQSVVLQPFQSAELLKRYDVSTGATTYYGSTTAAEMRELCNTRESYETVLEGAKHVCLPHQMEERGYRTVSLHNFTSNFFQRKDWYPRLGFETQLFRDDLTGYLKRQCGGPFRGPCDVDVVPFIGKQLREAKKPTFFYWMTLSTHVPIAPHEGSPRLNCTRDGGPIGQVEVCYMTEMWMDLFEAIAGMTTDLPPTEILLVGDHAPPLWSKAGRRLFTPGQVTWVRLTPKAVAAAAAPRS